MTIYSLDVLLSQFGTSPLFHVGSNCCFLTCIQISQETGKVVWYSHLFKNFPQFVVIHTIKVFSIVNEAVVDFFWNSLAFSMIQWMLAIWSLVPLPFLNSAWTMEYYSSIKRSKFASVLMRWISLESIIQSEVSQKEKDKYCILRHIYVEFRKIVWMILYRGQQRRHRYKQQTFGLSGRRQGWDDLREQHWNIYIYHA